MTSKATEEKQQVLSTASKIHTVDNLYTKVYMLTDWEKDIWKRVHIMVADPSKSMKTVLRYTHSKDECREHKYPYTLKTVH